MCVCLEINIVRLLLSMHQATNAVLLVWM